MEVTGEVSVVAVPILVEDLPFGSLLVGTSNTEGFLAAALAVSFGIGTPAGAADDEPSMATPAGITLVKERSGGRRSAQNVFRLGDEHGMKVYARHDRTTMCDQACMKG